MKKCKACDLPKESYDFSPRRNVCKQCRRLAIRIPDELRKGPYVAPKPPWAPGENLTQVERYFFCRLPPTYAQI